MDGDANSPEVSQTSSDQELGVEPLDPELEAPGRRVLKISHAVAVFVGGFVGTLARYLLVSAFPSPAGQVDWLLLIINVSGSFVLGAFVASSFTDRLGGETGRFFLASGLLGGWTTYSAIIGSTLTLSHGHHWVAAGSNVLLELIAPLLAAVLGLRLGGNLGQGER